eukprot:PhF_6_TR33645/c0_g1_i2/m.49195/K04127/cefD; isopenicillin-N epimerase
MFTFPLDTVEINRQNEILVEQCRLHSIPTTVSPRSHQLASIALSNFAQRRNIMLLIAEKRAPPSRDLTLQYMDPWMSHLKSYFNAPCEVQLRLPPGPLPVYGPELKRLFFDSLSKTQILTNAGSYGTTPTPVLQARADWEVAEQRDPIAFRTKICPVRLRQAANVVCAEIGAHPEDFVFTVNANQATSIVLKSQPWCVGDKFLILSCDYDATHLAARYLQEIHAIELLTVPIVLPMEDDEILLAVKTVLDKSVADGNVPRMANFCHVTSKTGWIFPVKRLTELCHNYKVPVMIDGAQAAGHIPIHVCDVGADYYLGTVHKWMYSCQGVAFLVVNPVKQPGIFPLTLPAPSSGMTTTKVTTFTEMFYNTYPPETSTWLSVLQASEFVDRVLGGWGACRRYMNSLAQEAVQLLTKGWQAIDPTGVRCFQQKQVNTMGNCLPIVTLPRGRNVAPSDAAKVMGYLLVKCKITAFLVVENMKFPDDDKCPPEGVPTLGIRITCQTFLNGADIVNLMNAVSELNGSYGSVAIMKEYLPESLQRGLF